MSRFRSTAAALAAVACALPAAHGAGFARYTLVDLGPGNTARVSQPGRGEAGADRAQHPVHWLKSQKKVVLESRGGSGEVRAMNAAGAMAGSVAGAQLQEPARWSADGTLEDFHHDGDAMNALVTGIDDAGTVVGLWWAVGPVSDGFVVAPDGTRTDFPHDGGGDIALPYAIAPNGVIAAAVNAAPGGARQCALYAGGAFERLGIPAGDQWCLPEAVNAAGHVLATAADASGQWRAVLWRDGGFIDLGTLGGSYAIPAGLNAADTVVGTSATQPGGRGVPFIWAEGTMRRLQTLLDPGVTGWTLKDPTGIGDDGRITGFARSAADSRDHAIVLVPVKG
jgi:probable HAF family extracellular repeat protein